MADDGSTTVPPDVEAKLHQLESIVSDAKVVPLSSSVMISRGEVLGLLADLRRAIPAELSQARKVVQTRDDLVAAAHQEAEQTLSDAKERRRKLIARSEVVIAAEQEAEAIVENAREQARQIRLEAEDYVDKKLANFEVVLQRTLSAVERGRDKLRGRLDGLHFEDFEELAD